MFRTTLCSSSGGQNVFINTASGIVSDRPVCKRILYQMLY